MGKKRSSGDHGGGGGHDGGGSLRWLLTYADMITLLMAFFIMMYSMSVLNLQKFHEVAVSIRSGFNGITQDQGRSVLQSTGNFNIKPSPLDTSQLGMSPSAMKKVRDLVKQGNLKNFVKVRIEERGLVISLVTDKVLFARGQAELTPGAYGILDKIAPILKMTPNDIRVEGHTCDLPISSVKFPTNWELSSARASRVVRYFIENQGLDAARFTVVGYADTRPLPGTAYTNEANRVLNRRVDIVILKEGNS